MWWAYKRSDLGVGELCIYKHRLGEGCKNSERGHSGRHSVEQQHMADYE